MPRPFSTRLVEIAEDTQTRFPALLVHPQWGQTVRESVAKSVLHASTSPLPPPATPQQTEILVENSDTFVAAGTYARLGRRVCVLNMASERTPGGGFLRGAPAQEESLCRRSTLYPTLNRHRYPIPPTGAIFSPGVVVFKGPESIGCPLWTDDHWFACDVVSAAAIRHPRLTDQGTYTDSDWRSTLERIRTVLRVPAMHGSCDVLILSAWGCGAFGGDPHVVARAFAVVLRETEFLGRYRVVIFAIIKSAENLAAFRAVKWTE
jgi:uncharacterized protein (TIGR02452 family)